MIKLFVKHLMEQDIAQHKKVVIPGSLTGWGDPLIPGFDLAVRLVTDTQIRIARIKAREAERFGDRILPGGDMYKQHQDFLEWAAAYDTGDVDIRSKALHDQWQKLLGCPSLSWMGQGLWKKIWRGSGRYGTN